MALVVYTGNGNNVGVGTDDGYLNSPPSLVTPTNEDNFVGLANQGATCYLNGLIQTLFMTPDFRKAVFTWKYDFAKDGCEELCIPLQLQKLFGQLQLRRQNVVDTISLTKSFGWEGFEVFQQQDVQELTRVLFDALEESFRGTAVENIIDELYAGELIDYLRCIDVDYQSERIDKFLDFSLAIVPFGSDKPMKTLTECIEMYLRPEILDGENKYYAEKFDLKVDAIKGLKFGKLPQLMSIQLKRFVYDFSGDYVIQKKLNDQVKFPMILNMNKYIAKMKTKEGGAESEVLNEEFETFLQEQMSKLKHKSLHPYHQQEPSIPIAINVIDDDDPDVPPLVSIDGEIVVPEDNPTTAHFDEGEVVYDSMSAEDIDVLVKSHGEWVYELYAVLIHSGAISGGHYYAYIKELSTKKWYNFNDSSVSLISEDVVKEAWGGSFKSTSSYYYGKTSFQSSSNAYMLMYRKALRELPEILDESIPSYILESVKAEEERMLVLKREQEELRNRLTIRYLWNGIEYCVETSRKQTFQELLTSIWQKSELSTFFNTNPSEPPLFDRFRLRKYDTYYKVPLDAYGHEEVATQLLGDLSLCDYKSYLLETRQADEAWEAYYIDGTSLSIYCVDNVMQCLQAPVVLRIPSNATVGELKDLILSKKLISCSVREHLQVMKVTSMGYYEAKVDLFGTDDLSLRQTYYMHEGMKVFVECCSPSEESHALKYYLDQVNRIQLKLVRHGSSSSSNIDGCSLLSIDTRSTLLELRQRIARELSIPSDSFRLFKEYIKGMELKDEHRSLINLGICSGSNILVAEGYVPPPGIFQLDVMEYENGDYIPGAIMLSFSPSLPTIPDVDKWNDNRYFSDSNWPREFDKTGISTAAAAAVVPCHHVIPEETTTDDENDNTSNQGNYELSPDDIDLLSDDAVPTVVDASTMDNALVDIAMDGLIDGDSLTNLRIDDSFFNDPRIFPALRPPSPIDRDSADITPLSASNIAIETVNTLLSTNEDDVPSCPTTNTGEEVKPSDFGERMVKNSPSTSYLSIPHLQTIFASKETLVEDLRTTITNALIQCKRIPENTSPRCIRLRDRSTYSIGKVLRDGKTLDKSGFYLFDRKPMAVQILSEEEHLLEEETGDELVLVQMFHRSSWSLSPKVEVFFPGSWSVQEISKGLSTLFDIPIDSLRAIIIPRDTSFSLHELADDVPKHNYYRGWFDPTKQTKQMRSLTHDMRIVSGDLLIVQNCDEPLGVLSPADRLSLALAEEQAANHQSHYSIAVDDVMKSTSTSFGPYTSWSSNVNVKKSNQSNGVRIKTHKERMKESEDSSSSSAAKEVTAQQSGGTDARDEAEFVMQGGLALFSDLSIDV